MFSVERKRVGRDRGIRFSCCRISKGEVEEKIFPIGIDIDATLRLSSGMFDCFQESFSDIGSNDTTVNHEEKGVFPIGIKGNGIIQFVIGSIEADAQIALLLKPVFKLFEGFLFF